MSDYIDTPGGLEPLTSLTDDAVIEFREPSLGVNNKIKKTDLKETLGINQVKSDIEDGTTQLNPRSFTSGRFDSQELVSGTLSVSGWYTIAETIAGTYNGGNAKFSINYLGSNSISSSACDISFIDSNVAKTHINTTIKKIADSFYTASSSPIEWRLAKSDTVHGSGAKIQVYITIVSTITLAVQIVDNTGILSRPIGFTLVTPYLDNAPTLPDGVTVGTFLEAGEELSFETANVFNPEIIANKSGDDTIVCMIDWHQIAKQGTGVSISNFINWRFNDSAGNQGTVTGSATISSISIAGQRIKFNINQIGIATTLVANYPVHLRVVSTSSILTIT